MSLGPVDRWIARAGRWALGGPRRVAWMAGAPRHNARGDVLDPATQLLLRMQGVAGTELAAPSAAEAREAFRRGIRLISPQPPRPVPTLDRTVPGAAGTLPAREYRPPDARGTLLYLHGGGWSVGDLDGYDLLCRRLAVDARLRVISVAYRLAPEHPFPAGRDDVVACYDALRAEVPGWLAVGGDSAGGNLTALLGQRRPLDLQLLIYPATDLRRVTASYHELADQGLILTREAMDRYLGWYGADPTDPAVSPLLGEPPATPAIVATAGFDPLRDEGEAYAEALAAAGAPVVDLRFPSLVHGFANLDAVLPAADAAFARILDALRAAVP